MTVWYNPTDNQIMAIYDGKTTSTVWSGLGYREVEVPNGPLRDLVHQHRRDATVTVSDGRIASVRRSTNPIQPTPSPRETERAGILTKIGSETATGTDLLRLIKLERGL